MQLDWHSALYLLAAGAAIGFCFWKPDFPKAIAARLRIRGEAGLRRFLLAYWIAVPVVIYRLLYLATAP